LGGIQHPFLDAFQDKWFQGTEKDGLKFESIAMHGRAVGIGVIVSEMSWTVEIDESNLYDPSVAKKAEETLEKVNGIFKELELPLVAKIYQHIDLGG
jgi:glycerol dehydrogenase-like iron-containing ADH family enzyme